MSSEVAERAARYVSIPSVSRDERALADEVERELRAARHLEVRRIGDNVVARTRGEAASRVVVAGHLDTVPGEPGVDVRDGRIVGLGACDMKGSIAMMVELATSARRYVSEVTWVFYAREEIERRSSGLLELQAVDPSLLSGDVAIVTEPTAGRVEAGCQGSATVELTLAGRRAHSARPSNGRNAIHRLAEPLAWLAGYEPRSVELDGVTFVEQRQAVAVAGGVANNVVPDAATLRVNLRVAPDRTTADAVGELREALRGVLGDEDRFVVLDEASPAPPSLGHPVLARLVKRTQREPRAKLGYTDVSFFSSLGMPAANFGAGDPDLAHQAGEFVEVAELERCVGVLGDLLEAADV